MTLRKKYYVPAYWSQFLYQAKNSEISDALQRPRGSLSSMTPGFGVVERTRESLDTCG